MIIPVVMASNDIYAPALGVAILSILDNRKPCDKYEINIMFTELSHPNIHRLEGLSCQNFSVRCIEISPPKLPDTGGWVSKETYYRILAADLLPQYKKILYLDCDIIVLSDLASLYSLELGDMLLGAVCDYRFDGGYSRRILGISTEAYVNAGVLLINASLWRSERIASQCLDFLVEGRKLEAYDQDAINYVCRGRILLLEKHWNFQQVWPEIFCWHRQHQAFRVNACVTEDEPFVFSGSGILHYVCAQKPWHDPRREFSEYFWRYARGSIFYEMLLKSVRKTREKTGTVAKGIACFKEHGLLYTMKRALSRIKGWRKF